MIICRTPYRISFFGGGTDYPGWYREHGGAVLGTSIDKYCYLNCRYIPPFFEYRYRIVWSYLEEVKTIDEIMHPVIPKALELHNVGDGLEIHHIGDLPARSGMGSSSSFVVGLLHVLHALKGEMLSKEELLKECISFEQDVLNENVGSQDQTLATYGGFNRVVFESSGVINVAPVTVRPQRLEELNSHLMLFYTGVSRTASKIAGNQVHAITSKSKVLHRLREMVDEGLDILCGENDIEEFGRLLDESWTLKRSLDKSISIPLCDEIYRIAKKAGATGGKLLGAGGGGFMLLFVKPERQKQVREALSRLVFAPFQFEKFGSQIIHYDVEPNTVKAIKDTRCEHNIRQAYL